MPFLARARRRFADALRRGYRSCEGVAAVEFGLLAPDLRGHGETDLLGQVEDFAPAIDYAVSCAG